MTARASVSDDPPLASDRQVLLASQTEPDQFVLLFDAHYPAIYRYAHSRLGRDLAEDVASETFLVAFHQRGQFRTDVGNGQVRSWLYGIATNLIRRHQRDEVRRYRAMARSGADLVTHGHDEEVLVRVSAEQIRGDLAAVLAALPRRDRDVLLLVALGGLDHREVAQALDIPYGTVCSRLNRARRKVRAALDIDPTDLTDFARS